jgi:hypothetical protein
MAGVFALACYGLISYGYTTAANIVEAVFIGAALAVALAGFCLGPFIYRVVRGHAQFARETLPWAR